MAHVESDYPLYYEAVNEKGLGMAGLNFVGNADYKEYQENQENIATFEFILWILSQSYFRKGSTQAFRKINLVKTPFSEHLPVAQLHWIIADRGETITVDQ